MSIDILPNTDQPKFPWIFRLPYRGGKKETAEPKNHSNQIQKLTKATFEMETLDANSGYVSQFNKTDNISFKENSNLRVVLDFDFNQQNKSYYFEDLDLLVKY